MSGIAGLIAGVAGLALLDAAVTSGTAETLGSAGTAAAKVLDYWFSIDQPLIGGSCDDSSVGGILGDLGVGTVNGGNISNFLPKAKTSSAVTTVPSAVPSSGSTVLL